MSLPVRPHSIFFYIHTKNKKKKGTLSFTFSSPLSPQTLSPLQNASRFPAIASRLSRQIQPQAAAQPTSAACRLPFVAVILLRRRRCLHQVLRLHLRGRRLERGGALGRVRHPEDCRDLSPEACPRGPAVRADRDRVRPLVRSPIPRQRPRAIR